MLNVNFQLYRITELIFMYVVNIEIYIHIKYRASQIKSDIFFTIAGNSRN